MLRQIIVPTTNKLEIKIPEEYIGKTIEYLVFDIIEHANNPTMFTPTPKPVQATEQFAFDVEVLKKQVQENPNYRENLKKVSEIFDGVRVDLSNYKFNREEANNYSDE